MEKINVSVEKYKAHDGKIFNVIDDCLHHDKILSGERKVCSACNGTCEMPDGYGIKNIDCVVCSGKGWVEKHIEWK